MRSASLAIQPNRKDDAEGIIISRNSETIVPVELDFQDAFLPFGQLFPAGEETAQKEHGSVWKNMGPRRLTSTYGITEGQPRCLAALLEDFRGYVILRSGIQSEPFGQ